jgi:outer membrane immunogenic protein
MWRLARIVLLATTASAVSISAFAADLPARMEPVAPVAYVPGHRQAVSVYPKSAGIIR